MPRGQDKLDSPADSRARIDLRVESRDRARWRETAKAEGLSLSDWIRQLCNARTRDPDVTKLVRETKRLRAAATKRTA